MFFFYLVIDDKTLFPTRDKVLESYVFFSNMAYNTVCANDLEEYIFYTNFNPNKQSLYRKYVKVLYFKTVMQIETCY